MGLRVLVVEDSLVFQKIMATVLKETGHVSEVEVAGTGAEALAMVAANRPDVIFLDLHLPDRDGLSILDELKRRHGPQRVVVVSGLGEEGAQLTIKALSHGAQQFIRKPSGAGFQQSVNQLRGELEPVLKAVCQQAGSPGCGKGDKVTPAPQARTAAGAPVRPSDSSAIGTGGRKVIARPPRSGFWITALAVSTGGPQALTRVIPQLPASYPVPIVLVQHMPPLFTDSLARSLDAKSQVKVVEASAGQVLQPGTVYIAPGGKHLAVKKVDGKAITSLNEDPPEQSVRPSADVLFRSLAHYQNPQSVLAVVLTGMGEDGLAGVRALKLSGGHCLTQSEKTCVVYGMPRAVDLAGLSDESLDLDEIAGRMTQLVSLVRPPVGV
jgi:two-component system chemotaxis response regulator CheB